MKRRGTRDRAAYEARVAAALAWRDAWRLPPIQGGSDAQNTWAETLRHKAIAAALDEASSAARNPASADALCKRIMGETEHLPAHELAALYAVAALRQAVRNLARHWIDCRAEYFALIDFAAQRAACDLAAEDAAAFEHEREAA